jgi:programmed cell death 6-interacting protein
MCMSFGSNFIFEAAEIKRRADFHRILRSLNLPASLDALDRPIGLPPSLLKKTEEVQQENGPDKVEKSIEDVKRMAALARKVLEEVSFVPIVK